MLEHLVLIPRGGLANRMRAIASARRLCGGMLARLTVLWEWGDPLELFAADQGVEWVRALPDVEGYQSITHKRWKEGGDRNNRKVPTRGTRGVLVRSQFVFGAEEEAPIGERALARHHLEPARELRARVEQFARDVFRGRYVVGMHIRRTDHRTAINLSPDELFLAAARAALAEGAVIFLATDNAKTEATMRAHLGASIITYPKRAELAQRWPRPENTASDVADDFADLLLLAACDHVVGSAGSSFSRQAIVRNGSDRCRVIAAEPPPGLEGESWGAGEI